MLQLGRAGTVAKSSGAKRAFGRKQCQCETKKELRSRYDRVQQLCCTPAALAGEGIRGDGVRGRSAVQQDRLSMTSIVLATSMRDASRTLINQAAGEAEAAEAVAQWSRAELSRRNPNLLRPRVRFSVGLVSD